MTASSLRLDQAPPFSVPLRFFLTAPLFPLVAAAILAWQGPEALTSRWSPAMLALTHLFTLGFLAMVMIGALMQLLPVLAGSPIARPKAVGAVVHLSLTLGTLALSAGFVTSHPAILRTALVLLGGGLTLFIAAAGLSLMRTASDNPTTRVMRLALSGSVLTVALGLGLGALLGDNPAWASGHAWTNLHLAWGLVGWAGLLVMGVSYQVVPMFQLTPPYPAWMTRHLAPFIFAALLVWSGSAALAPQYPLLAIIANVISILIGLGLAAYAAITLRLQWKRHRRLPDITTRFWQLAMTSLLVSAALGLAAWIGAENNPRLELLLGAWMILGLASPAIHGMLYKIVPFLVWLHLHEQDIRQTLPNMKEILPDARALPHLWLHGAALALLSAAILHPAGLVYPAAAAVALSYAWLGWNLFSAYAVFRRLVKTAGVTSTA